MRKLLRFFTSRAVIIFALILLQLYIFFRLIFEASIASIYARIAFNIFSIIMVIWIVGRPISRSYKLTWCVIILIFPLFGGVFYLLWGERAASHPQSKKLARIKWRTRGLLTQDPAVKAGVERLDHSATSQANYLLFNASAPVYNAAATQYLATGQAKLEALLADIESAERFIFMEYFIIEPGLMWDSVLEALYRKAHEGVEVRLMYDDVGCLMRLPRKYVYYLRDLGLQVETFNRLTPQLTLFSNNRDHRKIAIIDGKVAYTGGINLADEYINEYKPFGPDCDFRDASIRIEGDAVWSFTVIFLQMWELEHVRRTHEQPEDYTKYRACKQGDERAGFEHGEHTGEGRGDGSRDAGDANGGGRGAAGVATKGSERTLRISGFSSQLLDRTPKAGFVAPYSDSPLDHEAVGENVYLNMINAANDYIYITTPYLIIDDVMTTALCLAAKRGVEVHIVTPHVPDKKFAFLVTRAHYPQLLSGGVKLHEYTPGFLHAKLFVVDGIYATVGTINMDYRSFFLHFECGLWMYRTQAIKDVLADIKSMIAVSEELTTEHHYAPRAFVSRVLQALLCVVAPLL